MEFLSEEHKARFNECIKMDKTYPSDIERYALFYILSGNKDIWGKGIENFYSFEEQGILKKGLKKCLCSSSERLVKLGFNLYNGTAVGKENSVRDMFMSLDEANTKLALNAIKIRFGVI
jgi:hypothetical protein